MDVDSDYDPNDLPSLNNNLTYRSGPLYHSQPKPKACNSYMPSNLHIITLVQQSTPHTKLPINYEIWF